jgi:hypothetical protein
MLLPVKFLPHVKLNVARQKNKNKKTHKGKKSPRRSEDQNDRFDHHHPHHLRHQIIMESPFPFATANTQTSSDPWSALSFFPFFPTWHSALQ